MEVKIIPCLNDNYSYLILDRNKKNACVIDPSESEPVIEIIEKNKLNLKYILNTHHHYDHVGGNKNLKKKYNSKVVGFKDDKDRIPEIDVLVENNQIWKEENPFARQVCLMNFVGTHMFIVNFCVWRTKFFEVLIL